MSLLGLLLFFVTLGLLVFVHEMGHFLAAKSVGVTVEEFAIGFGPKLFTWLKRGGTDYNVRALPLGGFVSMVGMQPEDVAVANGLMSKPAWARAWVFCAGPLMNVILGVLVLCSMGIITGVPWKSAPQVLQVDSSGEAARIGLRTGDIVAAIDEVPMKDAEQLIETIQSDLGQHIRLTVRRGNEILNLSATPRPGWDTFKHKIVGRLGFQPGVTFKHLGFRASVKAGLSDVVFFFRQMKDLLAHPAVLKKSVGGPVAMLRATNMNAKLAPGYQYSMVGQLSLSLAVFNLLPIPVLDGGHLAILFVEVLRRRRLGPEAYRVATAMGLVFIGVLFVFLMYSDVSKWVHGKILQ